MAAEGTPTVTPPDVRLALDEPGRDVVSDAVLEQQIEFATVEVGGLAHDDATADQKRVAIVILAAINTLTTTGGAYTRVAREMQTSEEYDVSAMVDDLERRANDARALVTGKAGGGGSPSLHTLGK